MIDIVAVGQIAGAIIAIATVLGGIIGFIWKKCAKPIMAISTKVDKIAEHEKETYLSTLRLTIMSTEIPLSERVEAGRKYVADGGNGAVKHVYEGLCERYANEQRKKETAV